ncbi:MAG: RNA polymerase sigma factor [Planctomycetota bacterium]
MNVSFFLTKDYENEIAFKLRKNKPKQTQFKSEGRSEKWNLSHSSYDLYYRIMRKSWDQIYDELLVLKCQQGDSRAFDDLVGRWQKRLWRYAFQATGSDSAAWDIVQETWVGIIKGIRKLQDVAAFPQWAFRILNNKCTDWLRRQQRQQQLNNELMKQIQNKSDNKRNGNEKTEPLRAAIEKLSPDRRALLMLRYNEGFDIGQIGEILRIPEGTVKSRLHRTVNELRQLSISGARLK